MVGPPGSGKTEFVKKYILSHEHEHEYVHINQDILKTKKKCLQITEDALTKNKSVVIDNTNPDVETRKFTLIWQENMDIRTLEPYLY